MRSLGGVFLFVVSLTIFVSAASASWKLVAKFNATANSSFFFNEQRGFVGLDGNNGIKRTSNGGKTWFDCIIPPGFYGYITDIFMRDSLNGWAGIENDNQSHGLWYTVDGGVTWNVDANFTGQVSSVYQTPSALVVCDRFSLNRLSVSTNAGANFSRAGLDYFNGINFVDDLHGVASVFRSSGPLSAGIDLYTNDGGLSWQQTAICTVEGWGVYAQKGSPNFVIAGEKIQTDPNPFQSVYGSFDYGATWQTIGTLQGRTTGHIAGVGPVMYVQSWTTYQYPNSGAFVGMNRSTDGGRTWKNVGGPANFRDTRFSVTGCLGGVVYALDEVGGVWKTTDGGDGAIHEPPHNPNFNPDHISLSATLCSTASEKLIISNLSCNPLTITDVEFIDSTDPAVSSGALAFNHYPKLPFILDPASSDYVSLNWNPKILSVPSPLSTTFVKVHSTMLNGTLSFDTLFAINSVSLANIPMFSLSVGNVRFDSMNICKRSIDTLITFKNASCDTLWLDSTLLTASADWQMIDPSTGNPEQLPVGLIPGDSSKFIIRFTPSGVGPQTASLLLHFLHQGLTRDTTMFFTVKCFRVMSVLADAAVSIPPTSICRFIDTTIYLHNFNCDTLTIDGISNGNATVFSDMSGFSFPYQLAPGATLGYRVRYNPLKNVNSITSVIFHYHLAEDTSFQETTLQGSGVPGTSFFVPSLPTPVVLFPDHVACSTPDSIVFTIENPGCDSLLIRSLSLGGISIPALSYRTDPPLPTALWKLGQSVRVTVYLQAAQPSVNDGVLEFAYTTSDGVRYDSLIAVHALVTRGERIASVSDKSVDLGTSSLCIDRNSFVSITNPGCPSLTVKNISISGQFYSLLNVRPTPFVLAQGDTQIINFTYSPTTSGTNTGQIQILTNTDVDSVILIPLTATTTPIDHVAFRLVQENAGLLAGDTAMIGVVPDNDWKGKALDRIDFSITTNSDLLSYTGQTSQKDPNFQTIVTPVTLPGNQSQLNVQLKSPTEIVLHKDQPLVTFYYRTALTKSYTSPVALSLLSLNDADPHYINCVMMPLSEDGNFVLNFECGSSTLLDFLNGKMPILAGEAHPNPVTAQGAYQTTIPFTTSVSGVVEVEYFDALGKSVAAERITISTPGKYAAHFDASQLAGGNYQYVLRLRDSQQIPLRGRIVVLK